MRLEYRRRHDRGDRFYRFGNLCGKDVHGVRIFGGGTLHGGTLARFFRSFYEDVQGSTIKLYNSSDIRISDIIVQDSPCWTTSFFGCSDVKIDHVKVIGQWRYNTDGIDLCSSDHVEITDSLVHSFDDTIVVKGVDHANFTTVDWHSGRPVTDITVRNWVLWCGWGRTLEVGIETAAPEYARILFEDCDLIHNSAACLDVQNGNYADIHDVTFRNIRVEYQADSLPEIYQRTDDMKYDSRGAVGVPKLIVADNHRYAGQTGRFGDIHDILFENIQVSAESGVPEKLPVLFANHSDSAKIGDITIRDLSVNGRKISSLDELEVESLGRIGSIRVE